MPLSSGKSRLTLVSQGQREDRDKFVQGNLTFAFSEARHGERQRRTIRGQGSTSTSTSAWTLQQTDMTAYTAVISAGPIFGVE